MGATDHNLRKRCQKRCMAPFSFLSCEITRENCKLHNAGGQLASPKNKGAEQEHKRHSEVRSWNTSRYRDLRRSEKIEKRCQAPLCRFVELARRPTGEPTGQPFKAPIER